MDADLRQEADSKTIDLKDDHPDGVALMLEYLYILELPSLSTVTISKQVFEVGDKYRLTERGEHARQRLIDLLLCTCSVWPKHSKEENKQLLKLIGGICRSTYRDACYFRSAILSGVLAVSSHVIEDEQMQGFMRRNYDFCLQFVRALNCENQQLLDINSA